MFIYFDILILILLLLLKIDLKILQNINKSMKHLSQ